MVDQSRARGDFVKKLVVYVHGKGGSAAEAEHYRPLFPGSDVVGFDYRAQSPWEAREEFPAFFCERGRGYDEVILIANSIGAFFSMSALDEKYVGRALLISPVVDMAGLIERMMGWAGVNEAELEARREIPTSFGETLSWEYLCYVREHPLDWRVLSSILYGENDNLTPPEAIEDFARRTGAALTVMRGGEHWFHTEEQMKFLDEWVRRSIG